jgi:hypothetical protein
MNFLFAGGGLQVQPVFQPELASLTPKLPARHRFKGNPFKSLYRIGKGIKQSLQGLIDRYSSLQLSSSALAASIRSPFSLQPAGEKSRSFSLSPTQFPAKSIASSLSGRSFLPSSFLKPEISCLAPSLK